MKQSFPKGAGPFIKIISNSLKLWIRSQCKSLGDIKIDINSSIFELVQGKIKGVEIIASQVDFKGLYIHSSQLKSNPLKVNLSLVSKSIVRIEKEFGIKGNISLDEDGIRKIIFSKQWLWLKAWLSKNLLRQEEIYNLLIKDNYLELHYTPKDKQTIVVEKFSIKADSNTLSFKNINKGSDILLPMDTSIQIEAAKLSNGLLVITGNAIVTP